MKYLKYSTVFALSILVLTISKATSTSPIIQAITANRCAMSGDQSAINNDPIDPARNQLGECFTDGAIQETAVLRKLALCVSKPIIKSATDFSNTDLSDCEFIVDYPLDTSKLGLTVEFTENSQTTLPIKNIPKKNYNYVLLVADNIIMDKSIIKFTNPISTVSYYAGTGPFTPEWTGPGATPASGNVSSPTTGNYCYTTGKIYNIFGYLRKHPNRTPVDVSSLINLADQLDELAVYPLDWSKSSPTGAAFACGSQTDAQSNVQANTFKITGIGGWDPLGDGTLYFLSQDPNHPDIDPVIWGQIGNYSEKNDLRIPTLNGENTRTEFVIQITKNPIDLTSKSSAVIKIHSPMKRIANGGLGGVDILFSNGNNQLQTINGSPTFIIQ